MNEISILYTLLNNICHIVFNFILLFSYTFSNVLLQGVYKILNTVYSKQQILFGKPY